MGGAATRRWADGGKSAALVCALQVDLGQEKMLSGVMIQGGKHRDKNVFMKKFRVGHSLDGEDWTIVKEDNSSKPKVGAR